MMGGRQPQSPLNSHSRVVHNLRTLYAICVLKYTAKYECGIVCISASLTLTPVRPGSPGGPSFPLIPGSPLTPCSPSPPMSPFSPCSKKKNKNKIESFFLQLYIMYIWNITVILFTFAPSGPAGPASPSKPGSPCIKQTKTHPWHLEYCFCTFINIKPMFHRLNTHPCSDKSSCPSVPRRPEWPLCNQWKDIIRVQKHRLFYSIQQVYVLFI